jgi:Rieske Fe-S protein
VTQETQPVSTRRTALAGIGLAGLAVTLTACGGSSGPAAAGSGGDSPGGGALGATSEVPVGGGKIFSSAQIVVTQPAAGEYKAFSAVCTHQQCLVDQVANGTIDCPCHGSKFSAKDGSVVSGPASSPLPGKEISVSSGQISLA